MPRKKKAKGSTTEAAKNRAAGSRRAAAKRKEIERLRRAGEDIPREPRTGKRGPAPYAKTIAALKTEPVIIDAELVTQASVARAPDAVVMTDAEVVQELVRRLELADIGTAIGRLEHRRIVNALGARGILDPSQMMAFITLGKAQARDVNPGDAKRRPRVRLQVLASREDAAAFRAARDEADATQ